MEDLKDWGWRTYKKIDTGLYEYIFRRHVDLHTYDEVRVDVNTDCPIIFANNFCKFLRENPEFTPTLLDIYWHDGNLEEMNFPESFVGGQIPDGFCGLGFQNSHKPRKKS